MPFKTNIFSKIILSFLIIVVTSFLCFNFAFSQTCDPSAKQGDTGYCGKLTNPLGDTSDMNALVGRIIKNLLGIVGSLALLMFIIGGLMWMLSAGNEDRVKKGKNILTWATLGLVIIFTSYALLTFIFEALTKD